MPPGGGSLPAVHVGSATGVELPTALGTVVSVNAHGVSYTLIGSMPATAAEAAIRSLVG